MSGECPAPLIICFRRDRTLEIIERELGVDDELASSRQSDHDVGTYTVRSDLEVKVPVLIHPGRLKDILQHQFAGPAALASVGENRAEALHLRQCFIKPGLDFTLRLHNRGISRSLPASDQPYDERTGKNPDHERDDYRRHARSLSANRRVNRAALQPR